MANAFVNAPGEITGRLTDYIVAARWSDLPAVVRREALRSFVNIMGCTIGGARHDVVDLADRIAAASLPGRPQATLIGRGAKADALHARLINCLASSIYSFDDTHAERGGASGGSGCDGGSCLGRAAADQRRRFPVSVGTRDRNDVPPVEGNFCPTGEGNGGVVANRDHGRYRGRSSSRQTAEA